MLLIVRYAIVAAVAGAIGYLVWMGARGGWGKKEGFDAASADPAAAPTAEAPQSQTQSQPMSEAEAEPPRITSPSGLAAEQAPVLVSLPMVAAAFKSVYGRMPDDVELLYYEQQYALMEMKSADTLRAFIAGRHAASTQGPAPKRTTAAPARAFTESSAPNGAANANSAGMAGMARPNTHSIYYGTDPALDPARVAGERANDQLAMECSRERSLEMTEAILAARDPMVSVSDPMSGLSCPVCDIRTSNGTMGCPLA